MKRKIIITAISVICLAVFAIIAGVLIATQDLDTGAEIQDVRGTWKIASYADEPKYHDYYVFGEETVSLYSRGNSEPVLTSDYELTDDRKLIFNDTNASYSVGPLSSNNWVLKDDSTEELCILARYNGDGIHATIVDKEALEGTWDVLIHGSGLAEEEQLIFSNGIFTNVRNGEIYYEGAYSWDEKCILYLNGVGLSFEVNALSDDTVMLIDMVDRYVWEIHRAPE